MIDLFIILLYSSGLFIILGVIAWIGDLLDDDSIIKVRGEL